MSRFDTVRCFRRAARPLRDSRGAAAVEFALVFPLLLVVMIGIFEFGRVWNIHQVVTDASREGARRAVVRDGVTGTAKQTAVANAINNRLTSAGIAAATVLGTPVTTTCATWTVPALSDAQAATTTIAGCGWGGATDTPARVVIRSPFPFQVLTPVMNLIGGGGGPVMLTADFTMRNE
jgi:Flp pilus assembly protein TadG